MLVAELAFQPEVTEVVAADDVDVIAVMEADLADVRRADVRKVGRVGEGDRTLEFLVFRKQNAAFDADVRRAVLGGCGRSRDCCRGRGCKKKLAHGFGLPSFSNGRFERQTFTAATGFGPEMLAQTLLRRGHSNDSRYGRAKC